MPGSITPLPVMLEEQEDREAYAKLEPPKSIVVRYGYQKLIAELPYDGNSKPGCGTKLVIRTKRGTELAEMLTTTCPNSGCAKSITRQQLLKYIENSGGKDYPFTDQGKILRVAEPADLNEQARLDARKPEILKLTRRLVEELGLEMKPIEVELLLGGERIIIYYTAAQWVDFRELVRKLAGELQTRIEMHQVNEREEARLVADYERCGQYCCCKNFLKVLKPVSMRSAKVQKATLDPQKISGRCGRLMCCLRYEDETYETLRKRLPHRKTLVETEEGIGLVIDTQILTQLVLVKIGNNPPAAYPLENIRLLSKEESAEFRRQEKERKAEAEAAAARRAEQRNNRSSHANSNSSSAVDTQADSKEQTQPSSSNEESRPNRKRRRKRKKKTPDNTTSNETASSATSSGDAGPADPEQAGTAPSQTNTSSDNDSSSETNDAQGSGKPKRRRRRRRRRKRSSDSGDAPQSGDAS